MHSFNSKFTSSLDQQLCIHWKNGATQFSLPEWCRRSVNWIFSFNFDFTGLTSNQILHFHPYRWHWIHFCVAFLKTFYIFLRISFTAQRKKTFFCVLATKKFPDGLKFFPRETFALFNWNFMSRCDFFQFFYTKLIKIELK